jgi:hypothetical protein
MDVKLLLEKVKSGELPVAQACEILKHIPFEDIDFAKLDHHRFLRKGCGEVVFGPGKAPEHLSEIIKCFKAKGSNVLATKVSAEQFSHLSQEIEGLHYDPVSKILTHVAQKQEPVGLVAVCCAGTADFPIAEEAAQTAEFFGSRTERFYDIGVAGIHRLFAKIHDIQKANAIVVVAGMEGALGSVLAGMCEVPVVAVPTSVGYGASFGGVSALLTMLNSCAEGLSVVNIDNGFGGGYMASQINRLIEKNHG